MTCPHCRADARCKGFRARAALTLLGAVRLSRHYYHCPACHQGRCPLDAVLGLRQYDLTPAADEVVCLAGVQVGFAAGAWRQQWCHRLKHEGGAAVLEALRGLDLKGRSRQTRQVHQEGVAYFGNQVHRMDYPSYRAKGWQIGSGPVESACKTVVGQRLKGAGMRWGEDGADAVCHLRALFRSEPAQWEAFWGHN